MIRMVAVRGHIYMVSRLWWEADILHISKVLAMVEALICARDIRNQAYTRDQIFLC
jgi:hypothetical protein